MSRKVALNFAILPFRRCKRPCGADAVVTGGVLLSVIYLYAARVRGNELRSNHRRKRDALTVKSAAVLCCAPKQIPAFFSHKRAITFERLYTGTKAILLSSRAHFDDIVAYLPGPVRCDKSALGHLFPACREDVDACCLLVVKTLLAVLGLPRRRRRLFTVCPLRPAMMTCVPGCVPAPCPDAIGTRLYA